MPVTDPTGGYYLVQEAAGSMSGAPMAGSADATGTISMALAAGKVALTQNTTRSPWLARVAQ